MKCKRQLAIRIVLLVSLIINLTVVSTRHHADTGTCGGQMITLPFTDVMSSPFFCQIAEAYFSGLANGTSLTTYNPSGNVTRDQMAAFITRTQDSALRRGGRRAALDQFWTLSGNGVQLQLGQGFLIQGATPQLVKSDGADLWVANSGNSTVSRVRASDGKLLDTWTG